MTAHGKGWKPRPLSLSDHQLAAVTRAASMLPIEKRDLFLQRLSAGLMLRGRFNDHDVGQAVKAALAGLVHDETAA